VNAISQHLEADKDKGGIWRGKGSRKVHDRQVVVTDLRLDVDSKRGSAAEAQNTWGQRPGKVDEMLLIDCHIG